MYEARQNKEKVSRRISCSLTTGKRRHFTGKQSNEIYQFMEEAYKNNPKSFNQLMGGFPYASIKQALRYRTIASASVNGIPLGMSFSDKAYSDSDHAEDAIIDTMEIIMDSELSQNPPNKFARIINSIRQTLIPVLEIFISASPCERCRQRIKDFSDLYGFQVRLIYHHLYRDPNGGTKSSSEGMKELSRAGIKSIQDEGLIQR